MGSVAEVFHIIKSEHMFCLGVELAVLIVQKMVPLVIDIFDCIQSIWGLLVDIEGTLVYVVSVSPSRTALEFF
jgi:hypothetical protein